VWPTGLEETIAMTQKKQIITFVLAAIGLLVLPLLLQPFGNAWVRIADMALLYVLLSLGLNIVVGYAGLLDLGYVAFFAIGAYTYGLLASPHLTESFPAIAAMFPEGLHTPLRVILPLAALIAGVFGILLGAPTLRLRGDYLAIVTLGFGEIIRVFLNNLDYPVNITNGPKGVSSIDPMHMFAIGNAVLLLVLITGCAECCDLPPPGAVACRTGLDGHSRGRNCGQSHGYKYPQSQVARLRHGGHIWRCIWRDVRSISGLYFTRVI
jgi:ABC-type branched-subunit amino acid transport system permease subunit